MNVGGRGGAPDGSESEARQSRFHCMDSDLKWKSEYMSLTIAR